MNPQSRSIHVLQFDLYAEGGRRGRGCGYFDKAEGGGANTVGRAGLRSSRGGVVGDTALLQPLTRRLAPITMEEWDLGGDAAVAPVFETRGYSGECVFSLCMGRDRHQCLQGRGCVQKQAMRIRQPQSSMNGEDTIRRSPRASLRTISPAWKVPASSSQPALERVPLLVQYYSQACSKTAPYFFSSWTW